MNRKLHLCHWSMLLLAMVFMLPLSVQAQQKRDIHELFDETTVNASRSSVTDTGSDVIDVDLSEWSPTTDRPVNIPAGRHYRFYNGTLGKINDGTWQGGPLFVIAGSGAVTLDATGIFDGGNFDTEDPVVELRDGSFYMKGSITGVYGWENATENTYGNTAVKLGDESEGYATLEVSGTIVGRVDNNTEKGVVRLLSGGIVDRLSTARDVDMHGQSQIRLNLYFYSQDAKVVLHSPLRHTLRLSNYIENQLVVAPGVLERETTTGTTRTQIIYDISDQILYDIYESDLSKIVLGGKHASLYYASLENHNIYVRAYSPNESLDDVEPGTLPDRIKDPDNVEELTITGKLNGTDIKLLRDMACKKLKKLNIAGCSIVSGGDAYYEEFHVGSFYTDKNVIGDYMFAYLTVLEELILPNTAKDIKSYAMANSPNLTSVTIGKDLDYFADGGIFCGSGVTNLQVAEGGYCHVVNGVLMTWHYDIILAAIPTITGTWSLQNSSPYPDMLIKMNKGAFSYCNLSRIELTGASSTFTVISERAFFYCENLETVSLPESITTIEGSAFYRCKSLESINYPTVLTSIGSGAFTECNALKEVRLAHTKLESMGSAFNTCQNIQTVTLPSTLTTISNGTFINCSSLANIEFAEGLKTIKTNAFSGGKPVYTKVELPSTLEVLESSAFGSYNLKDIYCKAIMPPSAVGKSGTADNSSFAFTDRETCILHVPAGSGKLYKAAECWNEFKNIVEDLPGTYDPADYSVIENLEPGTLPDRIPEAVRDQIENLTITGKLNGTDIKLLRDMACKKLKKLNIASCSIVEGGSTYLKYADYTPSITKKSADIHVGISAATVYPIDAGYQTSDNVIGTYMFAGLTTITEIILPVNITTILDGAFMDCQNLARIVIHGGLKEISSGMIFAGSNRLENLTTNSSIFTQNNGILFKNAKTIAAVLPIYASNSFTIPEGVDSIAPYAFAGCNMSYLAIPSTMVSISDYAFCQSHLQKLNLPATVKRIGKGSFMYCKDLKEVEFTGNIEEIGAGAFAFCDIRMIDLSKTQIKELIGDGHSYPIAVPMPTYDYHIGVFEGNNNLTTLRLPSTIEEIGGKVFTSALLSDIYCQGLPAKIWCQSSNTYVPETPYIPHTGGSYYVSSDTFLDVNYSTCRLHVPSNTVDKYKSATGWKEFYSTTGDQPVFGDPNYITNEDELQARLNEIANEKPVEPVTLTIQESGITLTHTIFFEYGCKVKLTGGRISVDHSSGYSSDMVFDGHENTDATFESISIDFNNLTRSHVYYFRTAGVISLGEDVRLLDVSTEDGQPLVYLFKTGMLGTLTIKGLTIGADWKNIVSGQVLIRNLTEDIFYETQFTGSPYTDGRWYVKYDAAHKQALMYKMTLQEWLEYNNEADEDTGTEDNPVEVVFPESDDKDGDLWDGNDIDLGKVDNNGNIVRRVHYWWHDRDWRIGSDNWPLRPTLRLKTNIRIWRGSTLRLTKFYLSGMNTDKYIYVYGTLIIDIDVYIRYFKYRFIHVMPGGRVIWRGGHGQTAGQLIYNEGGTVEFENGIGDYIGTLQGFDNYGIKNTSSGTMTVSSGSITGGVANYGSGDIIIKGGTFTNSNLPAVGGYGDGRITISGGYFYGYYPRVAPGGKDTPDIDITHDKLWLTGGEIGNNGEGIVRTNSDLWIGGGVKLGYIWMHRNVRIHIISKLTVMLRFRFFIESEFDIDVPIIYGDQGYSLTEEDLKFIDIELPEEYVYKLEEGNIIIKKKKLRDIHDLFDNLSDDDGKDEDEPYKPNTEDGVEVDKDTKLPDIHILFGSSNPVEHKNVFLINNSTLTSSTKTTEFANIVVSGSGNAHLEAIGKVTISEGTTIRGFQSFAEVKKGGSIIWKGGVTKNVETVIANDGGTVELISGKLDGTVVTNTDITVNGNVEVERFNLLAGACIRVTEKLAADWVIELADKDGSVITSASDLITDAVVLASSDSYEVSIDDLEHVTAELPQGCKLEYDAERKAIVVRGGLADAIKEINVTEEHDAVYDLQGRQVRQVKKGHIYLRNRKKLLVK